jgi:hypothetical protein
MRISKYMMIGVLSLLASPVLAADSRDLTVEQSTAAQVGVSHPGSLQVAISADRPDATYAIGEVVRLSLVANEEAYVTVLDFGPTGQVTQLFPNQYQPDNHVFANRPIEIAGDNTGGHIAATGPAGVELIKVIASNKPIAVVSEGQLTQTRGIFRSVSGGVPALVRNLQVVADQANQNETKVSFMNFQLLTVGSRFGTAPQQQTIVVVPGGQPVPAATTVLPVVAPQASNLIAIPGQQPFPLLLAADKHAYKVGENVTLAVTSLQACNLTVLDVSPTGQVHTLFPNSLTPNNAVGASQTVLVAGGPSAVALPVSGPVGTEQIVAICSTDPTAVSSQTTPDRAALARDLTVVASRPAGTTAMASLTFMIQP